MQNGQITYLLGAGASAEVIPVVTELTQELKQIGNQFLADCRMAEIDKITIDNKQFLSIEDVSNELDEFLIPLADQVAAHRSIDTYAKKLLIRGERSRLNQVKLAIVMLMLSKQIVRYNGNHTEIKNATIKTDIDKRQDAFIASIIDVQTKQLPDNFNVITWNYDNQFELAYSEYTNYPGEVRQFSRPVFDSNNQPSRSNPNGFNFIHLNGMVGFKYDRSDKIEHLHHIYRHNNYNDYAVEFYRLFKLMKSMRDDSGSGITFAWERRKHAIQEVNWAKRVAEHTEILVVIGYSFPFFNKDIDKEILGAMKNLKRIYIQDLYPGRVRQSLEPILNKSMSPGPRNMLKIVELDEVNQFHLPEEII